MRYLQGRSQLPQTASLPRVRVPRAEFVALLVAQGMKHADAELQANFASALGSHVRIGDRMVGIETPNREAT